MTGGIPLGDWSGSTATRELQDTIKQFNESAQRQADTMIRLSRIMMWLTVATLVLAGVQFYVAMVSKS